MGKATRLGLNLKSRMLLYLNNFFSPEETSTIYNDLVGLTSWQKRKGITEEYSQLFLPKTEEGMFRNFFQILQKKSNTLMSSLQVLWPAEIDFFRQEYLDFFKYETYSGIGKHRDSRTIYGYSNFVSIIYYLNDNYSGGLFRVYKDNKCVLKMLPKAGDAIILTQDMEHESTIVKSGNKYIALQHWGYN